MSVEEIQVGQSQGKVGLKRKLTGPPRLLLGKFRAKTQGDSQVEAQARRHNGVSDGQRTERGSPKKRQDIMGYDSSLGITTERVQSPTGKQPEMQCRQTLTTASGSCFTLKETVGEREGVEGVSVVKMRTERKIRRWFWTPSLVCIQKRRKRSRAERGTDKAFLDMMTSPAAELPAGDLVDPNEDCEANATWSRGNAFKGRKSSFSVGTWSAFKRLLTASGNLQKMNGARLEHAVHRGSKNQPRPKDSFRKKMGCFFKRDRKKPVISAGHGDAQASLDEETMRLSVRPPLTGQGSPSTLEGDRPEPTTKVRGLCSETLMVSAEVSSVGRSWTEERNPVESNDVTDTPRSTAGVKMTGDEGRLRRSPEDELEGLNRRMKSDLLSKTASGLQPVMEETTAIEKDSDWCEGVRVEGPKDQLNKLSTRSQQYAETDRIPENIHTEDSMDGSHSLSDILLETEVQTPLDLNARVLNGIDYMQYCGGDTVAVGIDAMVTNGPMGSPSEVFLFGGGAPLNDFPDIELSRQCHEALLVQAASSLVKAAMKAALDQLVADLEAAESQSPLTPSVT